MTKRKTPYGAVNRVAGVHDLQLQHAHPPEQERHEEAADPDGALDGVAAALFFERALFGEEIDVNGHGGKNQFNAPLAAPMATVSSGASCSRLPRSSGESCSLSGRRNDCCAGWNNFCPKRNPNSR